MRRGSNTRIGLDKGQYGAGILLQDRAALESMGGINDRAREQIGPADPGAIDVEVDDPGAGGGQPPFVGALTAGSHAGFDVSPNYRHELPGGASGRSHKVR